MTTTTIPPERTVEDPALRGTRPVIGVRHYGRAVFAVVVALLAVAIVYALATNQFIDWSVIPRYMFDPAVIQGLGVTLAMTPIVFVLCVIGALIVALMRMSQSAILKTVASVYLFIFRTLPMILVIIFAGNLGLFVNTITIGIPFTDIVFYEGSTSRLVTPFVASVIALSLAGSGYMSEIIRGGLLSVPRGQREAAKALGLTVTHTNRYIVLPQALRIIIPPMGNELIGVLKMTALVSVIAGGDLFTATQRIAGRTYQIIEMLFVAAAWYVVLVGVLTVAQHFLEKRFGER